MAENIYDTEYVKGLFDRMSNSYERMNYITSFGFSIRWRRQFLKHLEPTKEKVEIIDLLTGMGETWQFVKKQFPHAQLTALDFSDEMIKRAGVKNAKFYQKEVLLLQQDVLKNELASKHYDFVICSFGLKTFDTEQLKILAAETKRILKNGGQFSFVEVSKPDNFVLKTLYRIHLAWLVPLVGKYLLSNSTEYKMLWHYTEKFGNACQVAEIFRDTGLSVQEYSYFYGCATGFSGKNIDRNS